MGAFFIIPPAQSSEETRADYWCVDLPLVHISSDPGIPRLCLSLPFIRSYLVLVFPLRGVSCVLFGVAQSLPFRSPH